MTDMDISQLEKRYFNLVEIALKKLEDLTQKLIDEREQIIKEHADLEKERQDVITMGRYNYDAMTNDRKMFYAMKALLEKEADKKKFGATEQKALAIIKRMDVESRKIYAMVKDIDKKEASQFTLSKKEIDSIENDMNEIKKISRLVAAARANPNSKELESAGYEVQRIEADVRAREAWTKEKIEITREKAQVLRQMANIESRMRREGITIRQLVTALMGKKKRNP